jgi:hypothetical protein
MRSPSNPPCRVQALAALERKCRDERSTLECVLAARRAAPAAAAACEVGVKESPRPQSPQQQQADTDSPLPRDKESGAVKVDDGRGSRVEGVTISDADTTVVEHAPSPLPSLAAAAASTRPRVLLVGAGPGDPGLLTVAAVNAISTADVVLADRLVPASILRLARGRVEVADKTLGRAHESQRELDRAGVAALGSGHTVVRLKGGDPFVFGRGGEEARWYSDNGYRVGVSDPQTPTTSRHTTQHDELF